MKLVLTYNFPINLIKKMKIKGFFKAFLCPVFLCALINPSLAIEGSPTASDLERQAKQLIHSINLSKKSKIGIQVVDLDDGKTVFSINEAESMSPASTMKLVTTRAALDLLGPNHRWITEIYYDGEIRHGKLFGNLYLLTAGDPTMSIEKLWRLLSHIKASGITTIDGDVIIDRSVYRIPSHDPAAFDQRPTKTYNVGPDAFLVGENKIQITVDTNSGSSPAPLFMFPNLGELKLKSEVELREGKCSRSKIEASLLGDTISVKGALPRDCGLQFYEVNLLSPKDFSELVLRELWKSGGSTLSGKISEGLIPRESKFLTSFASEPLALAIRKINKESSNSLARLLYLALASTKIYENSEQDSESTIRAWANKKNMHTDGLVFDNGSGLSRSERLSPLFLSEVLADAWRNPFSAEFISSLSIPGIDGTLRNRLTQSAITERAHLKTGLLNEVRSIAGYLNHPSGHTFSVVVMINGPHQNNRMETIDAIIDWIFSIKNNSLN
jgi:D-alanyl-D-alanine carboxypeptidase/D-alanyl-D-alanine-endopeptidase (penicillin-binding protein 4)